MVKQALRDCVSCRIPSGAVIMDEPRRQTRIQAEKSEQILEAALDVFSVHGFRGSTIDQIAEAAGMSKPNLLYYFRNKDQIYETLVNRQLNTWLAPMQGIDENGEPLDEIAAYIRRKMEMSRQFPRESRLFANEILQGAPHILKLLKGELRKQVDQKAAVLQRWIDSGRMAPVDPRHLIFSIWATTQHYADFDVQVRAVLGPKHNGVRRFEDAADFLVALYLKGLMPR